MIIRFYAGNPWRHLNAKLDRYQSKEIEGRRDNEDDEGGVVKDDKNVT